MTKSPVTLHPGELVATTAARDMLSQERPRITPARIGYLAIAIAVLIYAGRLSDLSFVELFQGSGTMAEYITKYFPPSFTNWRSYLQDTLETVAMGIWGTLLSAILAIPLAILASSNISPAWIVFPVRRVLDAMRAINEVVFALIFRGGGRAGTLLPGCWRCLCTLPGFWPSSFQRRLKPLRWVQWKGIRATGASKVQEIIFGVIPQVVPLWTSFTLYRF
jgi:phosphonate transport system permease protein